MGIIVVSYQFPPPMWKLLSQENKILAMPYSDDDYDKQCEEEEILFVDGGLARHEDDEVYWMSNREYIRYDYPLLMNN